MNTILVIITVHLSSSLSHLSSSCNLAEDSVFCIAVKLVSLKCNCNLGIFPFFFFFFVSGIIGVQVFSLYRSNLSDCWGVTMFSLFLNI